MPKKLEGKVAVVTGAASGLGRAIAQLYAAEGARVCIADIRGAAEAARDMGPQTIGVSMDVTDEAQVEAGIAQCVNAFGGIDILVSNAGVQHIAAITDLKLADWRRMLAIHLDGAFLTTRAALRCMQRQGRGGTIIYMGSAHSKEASPLKSPYITAKHGLIGLCKAVAKEGAAFGVRANVICPGFVRTPLVERQIPEQARDLGISEEEVVRNVMLKNTVDGQFTTLADVAETALFFAAFPSNALTGQSILVSHGWHMQ
jgi:3-hydroxybutyrate dehydrogenase